ncbi:NAD(P)-dependent oxidoreductase [Flavobacterium psychrotrophum]|uniref:NAD(P)-dependent oxidoreductase n=1 Tax=Flavobacterium psychrotrophum TaxID=2294119 RepID=UPI000E322729|nr:NAD(P)H-binding protein [Flavobacterium psychrotrophum]
MNLHTKIAVIGGTGKSGQYLVKNLLQKGYSIKMLVRNPQHLKPFMDSAEIITGDVTEYQSIYDTLSGCCAIISTLGLGLPPSEPTIFSHSAQNIIKAANILGINRYIVTTGLNVSTPDDDKTAGTQMATDWMYTNYPISTHDKQEEYELLINSNLNFTMVRLPLIELTDDLADVSINLKDCPGNAISATTLASFLVSQLNDTSYHRKAPFVFNI